MDTRARARGSLSHINYHELDATSPRAPPFLYLRLATSLERASPPPTIFFFFPLFRPSRDVVSLPLFSFSFSRQHQSNPVSSRFTHGHGSSFRFHRFAFLPRHYSSFVSVSATPSAFLCSTGRVSSAPFSSWLSTKHFLHLFLPFSLLVFLFSLAFTPFASHFCRSLGSSNPPFRHFPATIARNARSFFLSNTDSPEGFLHTSDPTSVFISAFLFRTSCVSQPTFATGRVSRSFCRYVATRIIRWFDPWSISLLSVFQISPATFSRFPTLFDIDHLSKCLNVDDRLRSTRAIQCYALRLVAREPKASLNRPLRGFDGHVSPRQRLHQDQAG